MLALPVGAYTLTVSAAGRNSGPYSFRLSDLAAAIGLPQPIAARDGRVFEQSAIAGRRGARLFSRNFHEFWVSLRILGLLLSEKQIPQIVENIKKCGEIKGTVGAGWDAPKAGALPGCATPRLSTYLILNHF